MFNLKNWSLKHKLIIALLIPIIGLIYFTSQTIISGVEKQQNIRELKNSLNNIKKINGLIQELQKERGLSSGFIGSKNGKFKQELFLQRKLTDKAIKEFKLHNNHCNHNKYLKKYIENINKINKELNKLAEIRKKIDNKKLSFQDSLKYYSNITKQLLNLISKLLLVDSNEKITQMKIAYLYLLEAKENAGLERSILTYVFSSNKMPIEMFKKFSVIVASYKTYIQNYKNLIDKEELIDFNKKMSDKNVEEVRKFREIAFDKMKKNKIIFEIEQNAGYGGLIHNFKNYLLRGEKDYANQFFINYHNIVLLVKKYENIPLTTDEEKKLLKIIIDTFTKYKNGLSYLLKHYNPNYIRDLDKIVKVDDTPAINALNILRNNIIGTDPIYWFKVSTKRIDILDGIEKNYMNHIFNEIENYRKKTEEKSLIDLTVFISILFLIIVLSTRIIHDISDSIIKFQEGLNSFFHYLTSNSKKIEDIKIENNDEIGQMAKMVNENTQKAKSYIESFYEEINNQKNKAILANKTKSEFLANMSHEIRTPLNAITGFIDLLKENIKDETNKEYLRIIKSSSESLLQIINDILDFAKIESGKLEIDKHPFEPKKEFQTITSLFDARASKKDITLVLNIDKNIPKVLISDPLRIKQVIANLISNAIKFTPEGKKIFITISYKNKNLFVSVKDEGIGIPKDKQKNIFEAFTQADSSTTRKYGGTGLGLAISYQLVKLLGGELKLKSEEGKGSEFYFSIPVEIGKFNKKEEEISSDDIKKLKGKKILLVEDNLANQMFMKILLKKLGFEFDIANDGTEAVEKFKNNKYNFVLMDENMPNMNGIEATKKILEYEKENNLSHTPIIALTANAIKGDRKRFLEAGMDEYLTKPLNKKELIQVLGKLL